MTPSPSSAPPVNAEQTLQLLWERVRMQGDLPGFAKAISSILSAMRGEEELEFNMTQTVLSDPALTQKVLRLANSSMYSAFGQRIGTVSKAVFVLGTETIGHLALGLKLIDELSSAQPDSNNAHLEMEKAVLAGHVARQIASSANYHDAEEAVVCSMLHTLGRMMVVFYLSDFWQQIHTRCQNAGSAGARNLNQLEDEYAHELLHISLEEIGRATASRWGFPPNLLSSMRSILPQEQAQQLPPQEWMAALSTMSADCASALCEADEDSAAQLQQLTRGYAGMLGVPAEQMLVAIESARQSSAADLTAVHNARRVNAEKKGVQGKDPQINLQHQQKLLNLLRQGLSDLHEMSASASPSQLMAMALETIYLGLGMKRAVAFMHNYKDAKYVAKISFGAGMHAMLPHLAFEDSFHHDVFHAALQSDKLIFIEHAKDAEFAARLPHWWKSSLHSAHSFLILPMGLNGHPAGFIYGDWGEDLAPTPPSEAEFQILNEIRQLLVQSLERRRQSIVAAQAAKAKQ
ncbi:HDOD domain-containing protein [Massilia sp. W12]|uniref:HDOD domain-containing protein n=1 Tax=Massilia sp. W12 TaxID=3126507 RepID=UPI0030D488CA